MPHLTTENQNKNWKKQKSKSSFEHVAIVLLSCQRATVNILATMFQSCHRIQPVETRVEYHRRSTRLTLAGLLWEFEAGAILLPELYTDSQASMTVIT